MSDTELKAKLRFLPTGSALHKLSALITLLLLILAFSIMSSAFFSVNNGLTVLLQTSVIGLLAIGMTMVIITGGIDLSVGSVLALSGVVTGLLMKAGLPVMPAMALGVVTGGVCGFLNGLVITKMRITPFVATLGMMMIARGVALQLTGAAPISRLGETFGWINALGARYVSVVTRDGREFLIPNEDLITGQVVNWSHSNDFVRLDIHFGTSYADNPHDVRRIAIAAAQGVDRVLTTRPTVCHIVGFGDSSVDYILRFWITDPTGGLTNIRGNVFLALWDAFQENGISIPFPQREVRMLDDAKVDQG